MLLGTDQKLAEDIVQLFRHAPHLSAEQIFRLILKSKQITSRAIFKELSRLVDQGILVRVKGKYAIKITWILELLQLGDDLTRQSIHTKSLDLQVPNPGDKLKWRFTNIPRMDIFWVQLMFVLFSISNTKRMYVWAPHFWFHLLDLKKELQAMSAMQSGGNKHYLIIGSDSYVDKLPTKYWNPKVYEWSYAPGPFEGDNNHYINVIDDFVLTVLFTNSFVNRLDLLCSSIFNSQDLSKVNLNGFFSQSSAIALTLENNSAKAQKLKRKFADYFGHSIN